MFPGVPGAGGEEVGVLRLGEDLRFPGHHGVEGGDDAEEV